MAVTLRSALDNYRVERQRILGGPHPSPACSCAQCDVIRAADLLYTQLKLELKRRRWRAPMPGRRARASGQ